MANYMAEIAKMLGVELGERFNITNCRGDYYFTDSDFKRDGDELAFYSTLYSILNGTYTIKRKPWKPEDNENYWYIDENGEAWSGEAWRNRFDDCEYASDHMNYYKLGNCYRTREEAEANRDKWVAFYASDEVLEV